MPRLKCYESRIVCFSRLAIVNCLFFLISYSGDGVVAVEIILANNCGMLN